MKECPKCGSKLVKLPLKGFGFFRGIGGYLATEITFWSIVGFVLSFGFIGNPIAFILGFIVAAGVFIFIFSEVQIFSCSNCDKRYKINNKNDLEEIEWSA